MMLENFFHSFILGRGERWLQKPYLIIIYREGAQKQVDLSAQGGGGWGRSVSAVQETFRWQPRRNFGIPNQCVPFPRFTYGRKLPRDRNTATLQNM